VGFLLAEYEFPVTASTVSRALKSMGLSKKVAVEWQRSETQISEMLTSINCLPFAPITLYTWMNPAATSELDFDERDGLPLE
jgi:hypothetical protein